MKVLPGAIFFTSIKKLSNSKPQIDSNSSGLYSELVFLLKYFKIKYYSSK